MKILKNLSIALSLVAVATVQLPGQTLTALFSFTNASVGSPWTGLILSGNRIYGSTDLYGGNTTDRGSIFAVNTDGAGFTNLHTFPPVVGNTNGDGVIPNGLVLGGQILYGTTRLGGSYWGTIFSIHTDGSGYTNLYNFSYPTQGSDTNAGPYGTNSDGAEPSATLVLSGNTLYGPTFFGGFATNGNLANGTLFRINADGSGFTNLHTFQGTADGANPNSPLLLSGNTLYGVAQHGGSNGYGTVFRVNTDGTCFTNLHTFTGDVDGGSPVGSLVLSSNTLFGLTYQAPAVGTLFAVNTDGTGFSTLHTFTNQADGWGPESGLTLSGHTLFGGTQMYGPGFWGTLFKVNLDGSGFTVLYSFTNGLDGASPIGDIVLSGGTLYGTANAGGSAGLGTVYALNLAIQLDFQRLDSGVVLSWSDPSFLLQAVPAPSGSFTNVPGATSPYTNSFTGTQMFFRLHGQ